MKSSKNIKVYGTLVNHTLDSTLADETHNDALMNAYQLFDGRFGDSPLPNNFQDVINKRITDITFDGGTTTIENRDPVEENHYTFVVNGDTNLNGDVNITEDLHVHGDTNIDGDTHIDGSLYVTEELVVSGDITGISLGDLDNVSSTADSPSTGDFLKYNGNQWVPAAIALSDITAFSNLGTAFEGAILKYRNGAWVYSVDDNTNHLNDMSDVSISGIVNGSILKWNTSTNQWEIASVQDILPSAQNGQVLKYNGTSWVAGDDNDTKQLSALTDVTLSGNLSNKILMHGSSGNWVDGTIKDILPAASSGQVLKYDGNNWVAGTDNDSNNIDQILPSASEGQVLKYINGHWVAGTDNVGSTLPAGSEGKVLKYISGQWVAGDDNVGATTLSQLQDVNILSPENGAKLTYDATSGKWVAQGSGTSGNVDISLGELNNVTEDNKRNSSVLTYDSTGNTWKPAMFGQSPTKTYTQSTITFNKVATKEAQGFDAVWLSSGSSSETQDRLYPGANNVYMYTTSQAVTIPQGYVISSITPNSQFGSSAWNVVVFSQSLSSQLITNRSNVPTSINGHTVNFNIISGYTYAVKSSDIASAQTTTSTSGRFSGVKPLTSNGNLNQYLLESSNESIYMLKGVDNGNPLISVTTSEIADINTSASGLYKTASANGTVTDYMRVDSDSNTYTYQGYLTTRYATMTYAVGSNYDWSRTMTSLSREQFLSQVYASGTTSPIQISQGNVRFVFIANKNITYPDTFQATITFEKSETSNSNIGGLYVVEGNCTSYTDGNWQYAFVSMPINTAETVIACRITMIPKSGATDPNGNPLVARSGDAVYDGSAGGFRFNGGALYGGLENYDSVTYKYIAYNPN